MLGQRFEAEIRQQPDVWHALAATDGAHRLAVAAGGADLVFLGSGSSLFGAQLAALAQCRAGRPAVAIAASEAHLHAPAYANGCVVALSQSGRSHDVLAALDALSPHTLIALTNDRDSPLARRADVTIDVHAARESAVPASKSVTATAALGLWFGALTAGGDEAALRSALRAAAEATHAWLHAVRVPDAVLEPAANARGIVIAGSGFGVAAAREIALKCKEAAYVHAEGVAAGEFRHGGTAVLDPSSALVALTGGEDTAVRTLLHETLGSGCAQIELGPGAFGPDITGTFAALGWIVSGQLLALELGRRRGIDGDAPRGLRKVLGG